MSFRAAFLIAAALLHAGFGLVGFGSAKPADAPCVSGCCVVMDELSSDCACMAGKSTEEKVPPPSAPAPVRDSVPQAASAEMPIEHVDQWGDAAGRIVPSGWNTRGGPPQGRHIPLPVLHCSFLN